MKFGGQLGALWLCFAFLLFLLKQLQKFTYGMQVANHTFLNVWGWTINNVPWVVFCFVLSTIKPPLHKPTQGGSKKQQINLHYPEAPCGFLCCFSHWTHVAPRLAWLICSPVRALRRKGAAIPRLHTWTFPKGTLQFKPLHKKITGCSSQNVGKWGVFFSYSLFAELLIIILMGFYYWMSFCFPIKPSTSSCVSNCNHLDVDEKIIAVSG